MNAPEIEQRLGRWVIESGPQASRRSRELVAGILRDESREGFGDALLVVSELTANASEYGTSPAFELAAEDTGTSLRLRVRNDADAGPPAGPWAMPSPEAPKGRGLPVVEQLAQAVSVTFDGSVVAAEATVGLGAERR